VLDLAHSADRLGQRDFAVHTSRSGIPELDTAAAALDTTARRLGELMERERAFSAHASHQLRTPLAGLRVQLEAAAIAPDHDLRSATTEALGSVDRLQQTIDDLLSLARDAHPTGRPPDLRELFAEIEERWHGVLAGAGRPLRVSMDVDLPHVTASAAAVRQILDVLVTNAAEHGAGVITVTARNTGGILALEVSDEGEGIPEEGGDVFAVRADPAPARGIGLGLARALAAAEGGRLLLTHHGPNPTFRLLLATDL
jgi:signal transduction histidine kinase